MVKHDNMDLYHDISTTTFKNTILLLHYTAHDIIGVKLTKLLNINCRKSHVANFNVYGFYGVQIKV